MRPGALLTNVSGLARRAINDSQSVEAIIHAPKSRVGMSGGIPPEIAPNTKISQTNALETSSCRRADIKRTCRSRLSTLSAVRGVPGVEEVDSAHVLALIEASIAIANYPNNRVSVPARPQKDVSKVRLLW